MSDRLPIDLELRDGAAWITLPNGDRGNAVDQQLVDELLAAVARARREQARVVVLRATGRFFCVGGDIRSFADAPDVGAYVDDLADSLHRVVAELQRMPAVVVSVVHSTAAGAGFPLAAAADVVLAGRSAKFTLGYSKIGLSVDGGTSLLVHSLGLHRALRLALLEDVLTAEEAQQAGLVARVHDDEALAPEAEKLVERLLAGPPEALAATKRLLRETADPAPERALQAETRSIRERSVSADGREGVRAFLDKRAPQFGG
ncbi:enoyl-CoA hydratase/isomerase family protein [Nocardioides caldifontis]|uniref:enoyl-CoA hydratase/isomerase family protein n=1 Tax=Nocardioides caldifontis TaxID=2588938 RepID=UPI0011DF3E1F|nr:enoyl-CoA hydratase-related protein [Nocardioides caldifontis]